MKACAFCAEQIQDEAVLCRFCGKEQPKTAAGEIVLFDGHPLHKAYFWSYVGWGILCVAIIGIPLLISRILRTRSEKYRITNRRIERQTGVLSQKLDSMELWRVRDITYSATIWDRLMGFGRIVVYSQDVTTPVLEIRGLPNGKDLYQKLLDAVEDSRRRGRVTAIAE